MEINALEKAIETGDEDQRLRAIVALSSYDGPEVIALLQECLEDKAMPCCLMALCELNKRNYVLDPQTIEELLDHKSWKVRLEASIAAKHLAKSDPKRVKGMLVPRLYDEDSRVSAQFFNCLKDIGIEEVTGQTTHEMQQPNVNNNAGDIRPVLQLPDLPADLSSPNDEKRKAAIRLLKDRVDQAAVNALRDRALHDINSRLRDMSIRLLLKLSSSDEYDTLVKAAEDGFGSIKIVALTHLSRTDKEEAWQIIRSARNNRMKAVRELAKKLLANRYYEKPISRANDRVPPPFSKAEAPAAKPAPQQTPVSGVASPPVELLNAISDSNPDVRLTALKTLEAFYKSTANLK